MSKIHLEWYHFLDLASSVHSWSYQTLGAPFQHLDSRWFKQSCRLTTLNSFWLPSCSAKWGTAEEFFSNKVARNHLYSLERNSGLLQSILSHSVSCLRRKLVLLKCLGLESHWKWYLEPSNFLLGQFSNGSTREFACSHQFIEFQSSQPTPSGIKSDL